MTFIDKITQIWQNDFESICPIDSAAIVELNTLVVSSLSDATTTVTIGMHYKAMESAILKWYGAQDCETVKLINLAKEEYHRGHELEWLYFPFRTVKSKLQEYLPVGCIVRDEFAVVVTVILFTRVYDTLKNVTRQLVSVKQRRMKQDLEVIFAQLNTALEEVLGTISNVRKDFIVDCWSSK